MATSYAPVPIVTLAPSKRSEERTARGSMSTSEVCPKWNDGGETTSESVSPYWDSDPANGSVRVSLVSVYA